MDDIKPHASYCPHLNNLSVDTRFATFYKENNIVIILLYPTYIYDCFFNKFCGNTTFGAIPSTSDAMQLYLKTHDREDNRPVTIGFNALYETI